MDSATGTLKWSYQTGAAIISSPTVANGVVYFGSQDHKVYALDAATGTLLWSYTTGGLVQSSPTVANGVVYVGSGDGRVYALNAATGVKTIIGGGWIPDPESINGKCNFGFTVQYNKKNAPKGNFVYIWRGDDGYNYKVKSNSWQGGGLWFTKTGAYFTGKCTFTKIDRVTGDELTLGNCYATIDITDGDLMSPVTADSFAITVMDEIGADAVILRQLGTPMNQIELGGGNIVIHK